MLKRVLSALIAIPLLLIVVITSGLVLKLAVGVVAILGLNEFYNAFENVNIKASKIVGLVSVLIMFIFTLKDINPNYIMAWFFISTLLALFYGLSKKTEEVWASVITIFGIIYVVFSFYHIVFISNLGQFSNLIWLIFIAAWATDTFAYFTGYFFGKKKLCPTISPKKTVEGAVGGIIGSIVISLIFMKFIYPDLLIHGVIIGFLGSIVGQMGDLTASSFKRYVGIKDYGKIMPGHGGVLDRFDSILFTAPLVYYYILLVLQN